MKAVSHWQPHPGPQTLLLSCPIDDVFFGGARGGGKTDGLLGDWMSYALQYGRAARGIIFRRSFPETEEIERRSRELYQPIGAIWRAGRKTWHFPGGAQVKLRYLARDIDADKYQGHAYSYIAWDEIGNWPSPAGIDKLRACLRSPEGIPCLWRSSGNPGGVGHNWVKARYVDPAPPLTPFPDESGLTRVYIPSRLDDNPTLIQNDPEYWKRVSAAAGGREDLLKAWRYGLWDIVAGGMFDDIWRPAVHVLDPFEIPPGWRIDRSFDWGSSKPFSVQWWSESDGSQGPGGKVYRKGTLFLVAEWYGWNGKPNEGLRLTAPEIARRIKEIERQFAGSLWKGQRLIHPGPADPSIFAAENGMCIADDMSRLGVRWEPTDTSRITGWERIRKMLRASTVAPMEDAGMFVFNTCRQFLRTFPTLPRDPRRPDDVDTEAEDHAGDACRYRVMRIRRSVKAKKLSGF